MKNYVKTGIIRKYFPIINYSALGYNYFVALFIKFHNNKDLDEFLVNIDKQHTVGYGRVYAEYDLFITMIFRTEHEFSKYMINVKNADYFIINHIDADLYPLKFFDNKSKDMRMLKESGTPIKIEDKDLQLLKLLNAEARIRVVDIANKLNISSELALYKLKRLEEKIIIGYRVQFNMTKLGYYFTTLLVDIDHQHHSKLREYCKTSKYVISLSIILNKPNCVIQLFHKDEASYRKTLEEITELFNNPYIKSVPTTEEQMDMNMLPFIK